MESGRIKILVASLTVLLAFAGFAGGASAGTIVADSGFRVEPNGFSFANYGNEEGYRNLDGSQMRRTFGNAVCMPGSARTCVLTPAARSLMAQFNDAMGGGHCYGFSALAWMAEKGQLDRFGYRSIDAFGGGPDAFDLTITGNVKLQRAIARAFIFQVLPSVNARTITGTPAHIVEELRTRLTATNPETYTLTIFQPGFEGGHAITPFQLEDIGSGRYLIHVYDNNWPGDATRAVEVDTTANTWKYLAATSPDVPGSVYRGDAVTKTMRLMPTSPGLGVQECTFCVGRRGARSKFNEVTLSASGRQSAHLLITDPKGRRLGFDGGSTVNEIPGARILPRTSGGPQLAADGSLLSTGDTLEPVYRVPRGLALKIRVDGSGLTREDTESVSVVGPTFDSTAEDIRMAPGDVAHLTLNPRTRSLSFTSSRRRSTPAVTFGAQGPRVAYRIRVTAPGSPPNSTVFFSKKPNLGLLRIGSKSRNGQRYRLKLTRFSASGLDDFARSYRIAGRQRAYLYYGALGSPKGEARIVIGAPGGKKIRVLKLKELAGES